MASHSRVVPRRITVSRTAVTLAAASAASVGLLGETGQAQPRLTPSEVRAEVDSLYRQAEAATQEYDGAKAEADAARSELSALQDELARKTARLNTARDAVGSLAAAEYRSGGLGPGVQLALSSTPDRYLERTALLSQADSRQSSVLAQLAAEQRSVAQTRSEAADKAAALRAAQGRLAAHKQAVEAKLRAAQQLLAELAPADRAFATADGSPGTADPSPSAADRAANAPAYPSARTGPVVAPPSAAPSARAAQAVAFAYRALGRPYVWGATGPNAYDCSGLTQAAWNSAGVSLPRTTYTQVNAGTRVRESQLRPGDLVFFYSGISHVGLYIGNGQMIHAPHPGAPVRIAPVAEMPFAAATRPG